MSIYVQLNITENYMTDLDRRLKPYGISHRQLAKEMDVPETQMSRWFNREDMEPRMATVKKIELAILELRKRQRREEAKHPRVTTK